MTETKLPETLQEYFDIAWKHAVIDKAPPSFDPAKTQQIVGVGLNYYCLYRGAGGCRCLIGAAIPDDKYVPTIENESAGSALTNIGMAHPVDIIDLQTVHDSTLGEFGPDGYAGAIENALRNFASAFELEIPEAT